MQNFEFRKSDHHRPSDHDINDGNKDRKTLRCRTGILALTVILVLFLKNVAKYFYFFKKLFLHLFLNDLDNLSYIAGHIWAARGPRHI